MDHQYEQDRITQTKKEELDKNKDKKSNTVAVPIPEMAKCTQQSSDIPYSAQLYADEDYYFKTDDL